MSTLPLSVRLVGLPVVGVGAGRVAAAKLLPMVDGGARVTVVAPHASRAIAQLADGDRLTWHRRTWTEADLDGAMLVVAGTDDAEVNAAVVAAATARGTLSIRVDAEGEGSADVAAAVRRGPLTIAVATGGNAPALAARLKEELGAAYGPEWGELAAIYGELRRDPDVRAALSGCSADQRRQRWRALPVTDILRLIRTGRRLEAKRVASACLSSSSD